MAQPQKNKGRVPVVPLSMAVALAGVLSVSTPAASAARASPVEPKAPRLAPPLATSAHTGTGTWVTLPMGRLSQPVNTFWQLFYRPNGGTKWVNHVEATATATNGGLVLAPTSTGILVGVRPSQDLAFTPLVSTKDQGRSWSSGLIGPPLQASPAALATNGKQALAVVDGHRGASVLASSGSLSRWAILVTLRQLAASPSGRACDPGALTAVGFLGRHAVVGASCSRAGQAGLWVRDGRHWQAARLSLPASVERPRTEVLGLSLGPPGSWALLALVGQEQTELVAAWPRSAQDWGLSSVLGVPRSDRLVSFGPGPDNGVYVLLGPASGPGPLRLATTGPPWRHRWSQWPPPPRGTSVLAFGGGGRPQAFEAQGDDLAIWQLTKRPGTWSLEQKVHVPVQYGSSS